MTIVLDLPPPNFEGLPTAITQGFKSRLLRVPFDRVQNWADYWALQGVERDHVGRVAREFNLSESQRESLTTWWLGLLDTQLAGTYARLISRTRDHSHTSMLRTARWQPRSTVLFQLWFNTFGPGGRCWFGNRYVTIRHYTFRLHWRP